jgi:hypothetical protein
MNQTPIVSQIWDLMVMALNYRAIAHRAVLLNKAESKLPDGSSQVQTGASR